MKRSVHTVLAWNVSHEMFARFLIWKGVDGLVLDRPGIAGEWCLTRKVE